MNNRNILAKVGDFVLGKGFYIVLFLCVATIGISGYYLIRGVNAPSAEPAGGDASVVLPDSEANGPDPAGSIPSEPEDAAAVRPTVKPKPVEVPDQVQQTPEEQDLGEKVPKPVPSSGVYTWPVKGEILRDFSVETLTHDPTLGDWRTHGGLDIAAALGTKVIAMSTGTVDRVYEDGLMGTTVVIDHGNGFKSTYCNLEEVVDVEPGDTVETGDIIGKVGQTAIGESGLVSHLHLEVSKNGESVDPMDYLPKLG